MEIDLEKKVLKENVIAQAETEFNFKFINGPSYSVAEKLREKGYAIAGHARLRNLNPPSNFIGILKDRKPLEKKFLGIKYYQPQKALHLGILWFNDKGRDADEDKNWILDVYGRKHLSEVTKLINSISKSYKINMKVNLKSEYPIEENYISDIV